MAGSNNQHLKSLFILKILTEKTDEQHPISVKDLILTLERDYNIPCERKSIYRHIDSLIDNFDADIVHTREVPSGYYLASRKFEDTEIELLIDAVESSRFISVKKSRALIEKLASLTGEHKARELLSKVRLTGVNKTDNEYIYYSTDAILTAIDEHKRVEFLYFEHTPNGKKKYRNDGNKYLVSPYALVWQDEKYYLHAYHEKYDTISSFRVDLMENVQISPLNRLKEKEYKHYDPNERASFDQFSGERVIVELEVDNSLERVVMDRFGDKVGIRRVNEQSFIARVPVELSRVFFGWVFSFGERMKIISPEKATKMMKKQITDTLKRYGD